MCTSVGVTTPLALLAVSRRALPALKVRTPVQRSSVISLAGAARGSLDMSDTISTAKYTQQVLATKELGQKLGSSLVIRARPARQGTWHLVGKNLSHLLIFEVAAAICEQDTSESTEFA